MKRKLKIVLSVCVALAVLVVVGLVVVYASLGSIIKTGVETVGPKATKAPVTVEKIDLALLSGRVEIQGIVVGNPEGFKTDSAFRLGSVRVRFDPRSVLTNTIHVKEVLIEAPQVTYEMSLKGSNVARIKKNVDEFAGKVLPAGDGEEEAPPPPPPEPAEGGKKVIIDSVRVFDGKISLSATALGGNALPVPLPDIQLKDIGKESDGASIGDATSEVFDAVLGGIKGAVAGAGDLLKKSGETLTGSAKDVGKAAQEGAAGVVKGVKGLFGKDK